MRSVRKRAGSSRARKALRSRSRLVSFVGERAGSRTRTAQSGFPYKFFARVVSSADGLGGGIHGLRTQPNISSYASEWTPCVRRRPGRVACFDPRARPTSYRSVGGDGLCSGLVPTIIAHHRRVVREGGPRENDSDANPVRVKRTTRWY